MQVEKVICEEKLYIVYDKWSYIFIKLYDE